MVDEPGTNVFSSSSPSHKGPYDDGNAQFDLSKKPVRSMPLGHDALNAVGLTDTYYVYSYDGKLMAEYDHTGNVTKNYIYLGDRLLAEYDHQAGAYYYYMSDTHRSTRLITDGTGTVVYSAAYDPYGNIQKTWTNTYNPKLKFSGKEREDYSGLDYFGARYYDSSTFRFNSVDPVMNRDEALSNPQLWNLYAYCRNNPTSYFDPDGRISESMGSHEGTVADHLGKASNDPLSTSIARIIVSELAGAALTGGIIQGIKWLRKAKWVSRIIKSRKPSAAQIKAVENQLRKYGKKSLIKSRKKFVRRLNEHLKKYKEYKKSGGFTSKVEKEIRNFRREIKAIDKVQKRSK